jgi:hypothetical protein
MGPTNMSVGANAVYQVPLTDYTVYSSANLSTANQISVEMESNYIIDYYVSVRNLSSALPDSVTVALRVNSVVVRESAMTQVFTSTDEILVYQGQFMLHLGVNDVVDLVIISSSNAQLELTAGQSARLFVRSLDDTYYYYNPCGCDRDDYYKLANVRREPWKH